MPTSSNERLMLAEDDPPCERNTDSSVSAQYEDLTPPDHAWEHEEES